MFEKNIVGGGLRGAVKRAKGPIFAAALLAGGGNVLAEDRSISESVHPSQTNAMAPAECAGDTDISGSAKDCGLDMDAWTAYRKSIEVFFINAADDVQADKFQRLLSDIDVQIRAAEAVLEVRAKKPKDGADLGEWIVYEKHIDSIFESWKDWEEKNGHLPPILYRLLREKGEIANIIETARKKRELNALQMEVVREATELQRGK
jgi:hypothetical protein